MKLTFYLFKEAVTEFEQAIASAKFSGDEAFQELTPIDELPFDGKAYFQKNRRTQPKWLDFVAGHFDVNPDEIFNTTNSFLLLLKVQGRVFAVTKGFGFNAIDRNQLERGFGLRVALNEIDPSKIKGIDVRKIDTTTKQKRVFLNRNSPLYDFDVDIEEDLVHLISGHPSNTDLARKLVGTDSLSLTGDVDFEDIGEKCQNILESFQKEDYKKHFGFIDYLRLVKDKYLNQELENILAQAFTQRRTEKLMLAYPQIDNLNQIERFKLMYRRKTGYCEEVDRDAIYDFLTRNGLLDVAPKTFGIIGLDNNDHALTKKYSLHDYTVFETTYNGKRYILTLGNWFELDNDYVEQVDREIASIPVITAPNYLPAIQKGQREDEYNAMAARETGFLLLDKDNYPAGGHSKIEVSDLLSPSGDFICVKKYNGSSTLSHLFSQGYVSAALFVDEKRYREFILDKCPDEWEILFDVEYPENRDITFVFAIASESQENLTEVLPFFSKVNLRHARKSIERLGFNVKLYKIDYQRVMSYRQPTLHEI